MDNETIVGKIKEGTEDKNTLLYQLYKQNYGIIHNLVLPYVRGGQIEKDDAMQIAFMALYPAINGFDDTKECLFMSYYCFHFKGIMNMELCKNQPLKISLNLYGDLIRFRRLYSRLEVQNGREPSREELAEEMDVPVETIEYLESINNSFQTVSIDKPLNVEDNESLTMLDVVEGGNVEDDVLNILFQEELNKRLWEAVDDLPERHRDFIIENYKHGKTTYQIAEENGITHQRVSKIIKRGEEIIRKSKHARDLRDLWEAELKAEAIAYKGGLRFFENNGASATEKAGMILIEAKDKMNETP